MAYVTDVWQFVHATLNRATPTGLITITCRAHGRM